MDCPDCGKRLECLKCSEAIREELWADFLEQYPNQRNEILRARKTDTWNDWEPPMVDFSQPGRITVKRPLPESKI